MTVKKTKTKTKPAKNYINNKDMLAEIIKSKEQNGMTDKFARMILLLTERYGSQGKYRDYTYVDDMKGHAIYTVCKVWNSFDAEKYSNPFAYFTQTIKRAFWQFMFKEENHRDIRDAILVKEGESPSHAFDDKNYQAMITEAHKESLEKNKMTTRFANLLKRHINMMVEDEGARESIFEDIKLEFLDYEIDKKTNMFDFFNHKIAEKSEIHDPTFRELKADGYEIKE